MELTQLKYFKAVAEAGKLTRASELLYVSVSALSSSVSQLERELGIPLFDREGNRLTLNRQGKLFLHYTNQVLNTLETARLDLQKEPAQGGHFITYAATTPAIWAGALQAFSAAYPHFTLQGREISPGGLAASDFHASFTFLLAEEDDLPPLRRAALHAELLLEDRPLAVFPSAHPLAVQPSVSLAQLARTSICLPPQGSSLSNRFQSLLSVYTPLSGPLSLPFCMHDAHNERICYSFAAAGIAVTFTTDHDRMEGYPGVTHVPIADAHRPWFEYLFWPREVSLNPDELVFRDFILRYFETEREIAQSSRFVGSLSESTPVPDGCQVPGP